MSAEKDSNVIEKNIPIGTYKSVEHRMLLKQMDVGDSYVYPDSERATLNNQLKFFPHRIYITKKIDEKTRRVWRIE